MTLRAAPQVSRTAWRYALLQVPAAMIVAGVLIAAVRFEWIRFVPALVLFVLWLAKDVLLYPLVRRAYETRGANDAAQRLVGRIGRAREDLAPAGYVFLAGELWLAEAIDTDVPIRAGDHVRIEAVEGLRVRVSRAHGEDIVRST